MQDLAPFLMMRSSGALAFFHREFAEVVEEMYGNADRHTELLEYWKMRPLWTPELSSVRLIEEMVAQALKTMQDVDAELKKRAKEAQSKNGKK